MRSPLATMALFPLGLAAALSDFEIPTMNIQGPGPTGIPGGGTAPANVTISFTLLDPNTSANTTCSATYLPANYPQVYIPCADPAVAFKFETPYSFGQFTLDIRHTYINDSSSLEASSYGGAFIVGDAPGQPGDYLTCVGGAPFDGIRCHITESSPIPVPITTSLSFKPFQLAPIKTYRPALGSTTDLTDYVSFTVADPNTMGSDSFVADCSIGWSSIASPPLQWENCTGSAGFAVLIVDNTFMDVENFQVKVRHEYSSAYQ